MDFRTHLASSLDLDVAMIVNSFTEPLEAERHNLELIVLRVMKSPDGSVDPPVHFSNQYWAEIFN